MPYIFYGKKPSNIVHYEVKSEKIFSIAITYYGIILEAIRKVISLRMNLLFLKSDCIQTKKILWNQFHEKFCEIDFTKKYLQANC